MVQRHSFLFSIIAQDEHRTTRCCATKALLYTVGAKAYAIPTDCITILSAINYRIQDLGITTILIYLRTRVLIYYISRMIFDLTIIKLNIISQSVEEGIKITQTRCVTITIFRLTKNFRFPEYLPLSQIQFCMDPLISNCFFKNGSSVRHERVIIFS